MSTTYELRGPPSPRPRGCWEGRREEAWGLSHSTDFCLHEGRENDKVNHMGAGRRLKATNRMGRVLRGKQDREGGSSGHRSPQPTMGAPRDPGDQLPACIRGCPRHHPCCREGACTLVTGLGLEESPISALPSHNEKKGFPGPDRGRVNLPPPPTARSVVFYPTLPGSPSQGAFNNRLPSPLGTV